MKTIFLTVTLLSALIFGCATPHVPVKINPEARFQARPAYPAAMREAKIGGQVVVDFVVNKDGVPINIYAIRSTRKEFESAATEAVKKWIFKPGTIDGIPANIHMQVPVIFTLNEDGPAATPSAQRTPTGALP
jgi:TonB family protein